MIRKFLILFSALLPFAAIAQTRITVIDTIQAYSKGGFNAYQVQIPEAKLKDVEKDWTGYLRDISKGRPKTSNGEMVAEGVAYKNIAPAPFTVISKLLETTEGVKITAWFTPDSGKYMGRSLNPDQNEAVKKFIRDFAVAEYQKIVNGQLADAKAKQKLLENKLEDYVKVEEKAVKEIEEDKRSIARNQDDLKRNESDQAVKGEVVENQKRVVEQAKGGNPDVLKKEQKQLNEDENDLKKLQRDNEKMHRQIDNWNKEIREDERKIDQSKKDQQFTSEQITNQKKFVQMLQNKLDGIK